MQIFRREIWFSAERHTGWFAPLTRLVVEGQVDPGVFFPPIMLHFDVEYLDIEMIRKPQLLYGHATASQLSLCFWVKQIKLFIDVHINDIFSWINKDTCNCCETIIREKTGFTFFQACLMFCISISSPSGFLLLGRLITFFPEVSRRYQTSTWILPSFSDERHREYAWLGVSHWIFSSRI